MAQSIVPNAGTAPVAPPVPVPAPLPLRAVLPWAVFVGTLMLVLLYFVGAEQGATSVISGAGVHEWVHDGRHLLGFPCH
ncbi:CbtB-domain containing protein [Streptomyces sp. NPDC093085]|uniref:CbtB domain-containing protein n=1 Tax=Streptomyces sp. NPDC093085 TaxID=3155068 RepID=UPI00341FF6B3